LFFSVEKRCVDDLFFSPHNSDVLLKSNYSFWTFGKYNLPMLKKKEGEKVKIKTNIK